MRSFSARAAAFVFTDLEGSTRTWEDRPTQMREFLKLHDDLSRSVFEAHGGEVIKALGDGFLAAFESVPEAVSSVVEVQRQLEQYKGIHPPPLIRSAIHFGEAEYRDGDYFGTTLNRAARLISIAHGGQCLLSRPARRELNGSCEGSYVIRDLGYHRLRDIPEPEHVFQIAVPERDKAFPPLRSDRAGRHNLPARFSSFVGRQFEWSLLDSHAKQNRLITITGAGGSGKSRLSIEWAETQIDLYRDGVWQVCLDAVEDPAFVLQAIVAGLNATEIPDKPPEEAFCEWLSTRELLLILDNCEHLSGECARIISILLKCAPRCRIVATSRETLGLTGEAVVAVHPLSVTTPVTISAIQAEADAVRMFCDRAEARDPAFELNDGNRAIVTDLCRRLDGLPLALELAAAWVDVFEVSEIAERLQELPSPDPMAPGRQRSLPELIGWSYSRLTEAERQLFHKLAVFSGGWTLAAAEAVVQPLLPAGTSVVAGLAQLVRKSLVVASSGKGSARRYSFLETIREFARGKLEEDPHGLNAFRRHLGWVLEYVSGSDEELQGNGVTERMSRLSLEQANIRTALLRASQESEGAEPAIGIYVDMWRFWYRQGLFSEAQTWTERCAPLTRGVSRVQQARFGIGAGIVCWARGDLASANGFFQNALSCFKELNDQDGVAAASNNLAMVVAGEGNPEKACDLFGEVAAIYAGLDEPLRYGTALCNYGYAAFEAGRIELAREVLHQALGLLERLGRTGVKAMVESNLGLLYLDCGDLGEARKYISRGVEALIHLEDWQQLPHALEALAALAAGSGSFHYAQRAAAYADYLRAQQGARPGASETVRRKSWLCQQTDTQETVIMAPTPDDLIDLVRAVAKPE